MEDKIKIYGLLISHLKRDKLQMFWNNSNIKTAFTNNLRAD